MNEHESDILIAEPEEEILEDTEVLNEETNDGNLFEDKNKMFQYYNSPKLKENKTIKKETDAFVNYKFNNLNKVYKKYDVVQTYVPKAQKKVSETKKQNKQFEKFVTEQDSYSPEKETVLVEKVQDKPSFKLKNKAKVWLVSIIAIFVLLFGLAIYNGIHINNLNNQITQTSTSINNYNSEIKKVVSSIDKLTDEDNILNSAGELGLEKVTDENKVNIDFKEKNKVEDYKRQTNFFDRICNFFRNLFGG